MKTRVEIVEATRAHALELAPLLRDGDVAEGRALGLEPGEALLSSLDASELAYAVLFNGEVAVMFGVVPLVGRTVLGGGPDGQVWMLSGRGVDRHPKAFLKASRQVMPRLLERYPRLSNIIDARYTGALRWAQWLGFTLFDAIPVGPEGHLFHPFVVARA